MVPWMPIPARRGRSRSKGLVETIELRCLLAMLMPYRVFILGSTDISVMSVDFENEAAAGRCIADVN